MTMKTNPLKNKLARIVAAKTMLSSFVVISLHMTAVSLAQSPWGTSLLIPSSAYTNEFTSSLIIQNMSGFPNIVDITTYNTSGSPMGSRRIVLQQAQRFWSSNILKELGAPQGSFGPIRIDSTNGQLLSAVSEVRSNQGTAGFFSGISITTAWTAGYILDAIDDGPPGTPDTFRTNLGLNTVEPRSAQVTIYLRNDSGQLVRHCVATSWLDSSTSWIPGNLF
jgi:hypothetical protein